MIRLIHIIVVALSVGVLTTLLIFFLWRWCCYKERKPNQNTPPDHQTRQPGITPVQEQSTVSPLHHHPPRRLDLSDGKKRGNYYVFRPGVSSRPLFNWADHPTLVTDAVENGWSRFGFSSYTSASPSARSGLLGLCAVCDYGTESETEVTWEVCEGSADFMQKIRLNPGLKKVININNNINNNTNNNNNNRDISLSAASVIKTSLPLPGPTLGNSAFPQEAYFEICILYCRDDCTDSDESIEKAAALKEGEKAKLIQEKPNGNWNLESLVHVNGKNNNNNSRSLLRKAEDLKMAGKDDENGEELVMLSVGLTLGGSLPLRLPGSYPGSIGFNSNGSVYIDGIKLVYESKSSEWGRKDKVIGCGFDPKQKKVFFTVDSELVYLINCKTEEFGTPLYPTIAANSDVMVLVNFGQSAFRYAPANAQRTPNPCFIGPLVNSPALGYDDSKELFSMGRIDSHWLDRPANNKSTFNSTSSNNLMTEYEEEEESEADLFEIVLDNGGRTPKTSVVAKVDKDN